GDVGMPVTHADAHGEAVAQQPLDTSRLRLRELANRRAAADPGVARLDLRHELRAHRPAAAHVEEIGLDVVQAVRSAVRHEEYGDGLRLSRHAPTPPRPAAPRSAFRGARRGPG